MQEIQTIRLDGYPIIKDFSRMKKPNFKVDINDPNFDKPIINLYKNY